MIIRNTKPEDLEDVMEIYDIARRFMKETGNKNQWGSSHPKKEIIEDDIKNNNGYVVVENGEIIGSFFFKIGDDPTYSKIYGGDWVNKDKYGVIHRIAMKYQGRSIAGFVYNHCFNIINNLKIDTHKDNIPMQNSLSKNGFVRCGIIHLENGDERVAYQKAK